ncbi:MAG: helix-hairpin-helix domain-containing protein, partial [Blastopirellula sp. JB062]
MNDFPQSFQDPDFRAKLRLALISGIGPRITQVLLERFGTQAAILSATRDQLEQVAGVGPKLSRKISQAGEIDIDRELSLCVDFGVDIMTRDDPRYP